MNAIKEELTQEMNNGVIEKFLNQLPEKVFHLGVRIVLAAIAFLIGVQIIRIVRHILKKAFNRGHLDLGAAKFVDSFVKFTLYFVLILSISAGLGVDAASILAILGSVGVAIGLAVQGSLSNLIGGILILSMKPFELGDYIKDTQGNEGSVDTIELFFTRLRTIDNKVIILPNGNLANSAIINYTKCNERRVEVSVGISYEQDISVVKQILLELMCRDLAILQDKEKLVVVDSLGDNGVNISVKCWTVKESYWELKWRLTESIKDEFDRNKIKIPYPQMDVHFIRNEF